MTTKGNEMLFPNGVPSHRFCAILSIICPFAVAILSWLVISQHDGFWTTVNSNLDDDANRNAGAMMGAAMGIEILLFVALGCIVGLFLALLSLAIERTKLRFYALALNLLPFLVFVLVKI
jgi:hypothetical protein